MNMVLSKIERLTDAGVPAAQHAFDQVKAKRKTQREMGAELNAALAAAGLSPIAPSTFGRWVLKVRSGEARRPEVV